MHTPLSLKFRSRVVRLEGIGSRPSEAPHTSKLSACDREPHFLIERIKSFIIQRRVLEREILS